MEASQGHQGPDLADSWTVRKLLPPPGADPLEQPTIFQVRWRQADPSWNVQSSSATPRPSGSGKRGQPPKRTASRSIAVQKPPCPPPGADAGSGLGGEWPAAAEPLTRKSPEVLPQAGPLPIVARKWPAE